jgi:hypothetical protein
LLNNDYTGSLVLQVRFVTNNAIRTSP